MKKPLISFVRRAKPVVMSFVVAMLVGACGGGGGGGNGSVAVAPDITVPNTPTPVVPITPTPPVPVPVCYGSAIPALGTLVYAPVVLQPTGVDDIVGFNIQNTDTSASTRRIFSFGQVFVAGKVQPADALHATFGGVDAPVQMDALSLWPDGSVKLASLALQVPALCASSQVSALLSKTSAASTMPVSMTADKTSLSVTLNFSSGSYSGSRTVDLGAALQSSLANPDYWLRGPLVTQARVDLPLVASGLSAASASLHLTADVSVFADGSAVADVQFNNDLTTILPAGGPVGSQAALPALVYTATINFRGTVVTQSVSQDQYTSWHAIVQSASTVPFNIQHDIAQLKSAGAILPYDLATGVNKTLLQDYDQFIVQSAGFGWPLAANGIRRYMPNTGGRSDIGYTTQWNTVWLLTQDVRAAKVAMAQSDTSGAVPWNHKLANGRWLTPAESSNMWVDNVDWRGGTAYGSYAGIVNKANTDPYDQSGGSRWMPDGDHQPNLNYIPYLMSGARWNLDRLHAQAAFTFVNIWPDARCQQTPAQSSSSCDIILNGSNQVRGQAWGFRELRQAAFVARTGSYESTVFSQAVANNWAFVNSQTPLWGAAQGQATGWVPGAYATSGVTPEWQQDFMTGVVMMASLMGDLDARNFISWQQPWLSGRFTGVGMNPYDGCTYNLVVKDGAGAYLNTWSAIEAATVSAGLSNGTGWSQSQGYYCALARSSLSMALQWSPNDTALKQALTWLESHNPPYADQVFFRSDPTFNIGKSN